MITEETKIQNTTLPKSIKNILSRCNIFTIKNLLKCDIHRLRRIRGLGENRINSIGEYLKDNGFNLSGY